jgi:hypothetical protein
MLFPDTPLARRIESAECRLSVAIVDAAVARGGDAFAVHLGGGAAVFSGAGSPINKVIGIGFGEPIPDGTWETVERRFGEKGCPVRVEISTLADAALAAALTRRGYVLTDYENVLGHEVSAATGGQTTAVDGVVIARNEGDLATWMDVVVEGFAHPDGSPQSSEVFEDETLRQAFHDFAASAGFTRYLARVNGVNAGGHRTVLWGRNLTRLQAPRRAGGPARLPSSRCGRGRL